LERGYVEAQAIRLIVRQDIRQRHCVAADGAMSGDDKDLLREPHLHPRGRRSVAKRLPNWV
jgi:hypothetical protein